MYILIDFNSNIFAVDKLEDCFAYEFNRLPLSLSKRIFYSVKLIKKKCKYLNLF
jgi:hypothetical protein